MADLRWLCLLLLGCGASGPMMAADLHPPYSNVPTRAASGRFVLPGVSRVAALWAASASDIWAPLRVYEMNGEVLTQKPPLLHYDGATWTTVSGPTAMTPEDISGSSSSDVWVVGVDATDATVVIHWDGAAWTMASTFPAGDDGGKLALVYAASPSAVTVCRGTTVRQWDGTKWTETHVSADRITRVAGLDKDHVYLLEVTLGTGRLFLWDGSTETAVTYPSPFQIDVSSVNLTRDSGLWLGMNDNEVVSWDRKAAISPWYVLGNPGDAVIQALGTTSDGWFYGSRPDTTKTCEPVGIRGGCIYPEGALAMHYDGSTWTTVAASDLELPITAAVMTGPDSAWLAAEALVHVP